MGEITLREYLESRINAIEQRLTSERTLLVHANDARTVELERRLNALNELRNEVLSDRALFVTRDAFEVVASRMATFLLREQYDEQQKGLVDKVDLNVGAIAEVRREISNVRSRNAGYAAALGLALTIITAVMTIIQIVHH